LLIIKLFNVQRLNFVKLQLSQDWINVLLYIARIPIQSCLFPFCSVNVQVFIMPGFYGVIFDIAVVTLLDFLNELIHLSLYILAIAAGAIETFLLHSAGIWICVFYISFPSHLPYLLPSKSDDAEPNYT